MLRPLSRSIFSPLNRGLIVKHTKHAFLAFVTCAAMVALTGCGDRKQVSEVKALPFGDANMTVDQALDNREVCDPKWTTSQDDHNRTVVEYDCNYKGIDDSMFVKNGMDVVSAGDVWQWTYGPDGTPSLTGVGLVIRHKDGTAATTNYGAIMVEALSKLVVDNKVTNFDQAYSWLTNTRIPGPPEATKSASPIPDTTYGNKLAQFFPGQPANDAAIHAYLQKGMSQSTKSFGVDSAGYLALEDSSETRALVYPVDPADVQIGFKVDPAIVPEILKHSLNNIEENKLFCLNDYCYDIGAHLVGKATPEVVAKEDSRVNSYSQIMLDGRVVQPAQAQQPLQAPSQQAMQQAVQQDAAAQASAANPLPTGSSDDDWPAMTPCLQKLEDAARKQADAQGIDDSISIDAAKEMASTCKTLGQ